MDFFLLQAKLVLEQLIGPFFCHLVYITGDRGNFPNCRNGFLHAGRGGQIKKRNFFKTRDIEAERFCREFHNNPRHWATVQK